jgi:predicted protein tyrosine phosphatase
MSIDWTKVLTMTTTYDLYEIPTKNGTMTVLPTVRNLREAMVLNDDFPAILTVGPRESEVDFGHKNHMVQTFGDVRVDSWQAPKQFHVEEIVQFGIDNEEDILVHCHQGMSRSTSSAIGILLARGVDSETAVSGLRRIHPNDRPFIPNKIVIDILSEMFNEPDLPKIVKHYEWW